MDRDLPRPQEILEELADKVTAEIERLAPVAFDKALDEMLTYHRFLLALNASQMTDGTPFSYATIAESGWVVPHEIWLRQYFRLFERAANRLPEDDHFVRRLAVTPRRLIYGGSVPALPANVEATILRLVPALMHRIEGWITKRALANAGEENGQIIRRNFAGSDAKSYENVMPHVIGAWEELLLYSVAGYDQAVGKRKKNAEQWRTYCTNWSTLWNHLTTTAHCLAITVWNEDKIGARFFSDALVRWPENLSHRLSDLPQLRYPRLVFPTLLKMSWPDAESNVSAIAYSQEAIPSPKQLYWHIVCSAHNDVVILTAALLLHWTITQKQVSALGVSTARRLLNEDSAETSAVQKRDFRSLVLDLVRMAAAREISSKESYANELDGLVEKLDRMTETVQVPGRIYTPTTIHGRYDLTRAIVSIIVAQEPENNGTLLEDIAELAIREDILPEGDESLRRIINELEHWKLALERDLEAISKVSDILHPERRGVEDVAMLKKIVRSATEVIQRERNTRLRARPIDSEWLNETRSRIELALLNEPPKIPFFRDVVVGLATHAGDANWIEVSLEGIPKGRLTRPPMESRSSNLGEWLMSQLQQRAAQQIWRALSERREIEYSSDATVDSEKFWRQLEGLIRQAGPSPVLLVPRPSEERALRRLVYSKLYPNTMVVDTNHPSEGVNSFVATINGVAVFGADLEVGKCWLFSSELLRSVRYALNGDGGKIVDIAYEIDSEMKVTVEVRARQLLEWANSVMFRINLPKQG
ncbi:MAG: hypothetical protein OXG16_01590 [Rhodospirillales bacterium]|nr:hypothetical protein [Rhodospirillales bacterium]